MVDFIQTMEPMNKQTPRPKYKFIHHLASGNSGLSASISPATIPSKYQTVRFEIPERKGFGSQTRRFDDDFQSENPGPGSYDYIHKSIETFSTSVSKRGMGGLAAKASRQGRKSISQTPGANAYNIPSRFLSKVDYHQGNSSMFQRPIAMKVDDLKNVTPGPNEYNVSNVYLGKTNNVSAESAFLSRTRRDLIPPGKLKGPSPCQYKVNHSLTKESPKSIVSSFRSKTIRLKYPKDSNPGPATYQPYKSMGQEQVQYAHLHPWKKHYMCISAPPFPVHKNPTPPGPGYYDVVDFHDPPKHYMSNAVFVSNTSRWTGNAQNKDAPGPASYAPKKSGKQSFLYNTDNKWVPS
ncbi:O(6)-methylguanine-induced apoptosis 2 isoform X2 [Chiloscyllium plagiosum]|nr:O(6)-methylguanine-induced apoptosis 2 isoform X2 [Chiloscyllium plagiosum]XP_043573615.1 O(6)-methylguanine-induced apoptosis 2 isoform X2 [Chiloscyllium plagiosum]XP_043573616.1 O(6)-methylguanine-induced apoptosis 2 isoform X2 [Chiloscyllium plagiosum]